MPAAPAELTARVTVPGQDEAIAAAREAAAPSGLARESGPGELAIEGRHDAVLQAFGVALSAALGAGAREVDVRFEAPKESRG
jgi:uncharacterized protein YqgV (UPF0045/DUF77 family)